MAVVGTSLDVFKIRKLRIWYETFSPAISKILNNWQHSILIKNYITPVYKVILQIASFIHLQKIRGGSRNIRELGNLPRRAFFSFVLCFALRGSKTTLPNIFNRNTTKLILRFLRTYNISITTLKLSMCVKIAKTCCHWLLDTFIETDNFKLSWKQFCIVAVAPIAGKLRNKRPTFKLNSS